MCLQPWKIHPYAVKIHTEVSQYTPFPLKQYLADVYENPLDAHMGCNTSVFLEQSGEDVWRIHQRSYFPMLSCRPS